VAPLSTKICEVVILTTFFYKVLSTNTPVLIYAEVTNEITRTLVSKKQKYIVEITFISPILKHLHEGCFSCKNENLLLISFYPSEDIAIT